MRAVASRRARGGDRRGAERPRRSEARARGGVRGDGLRGERRPRRAVARRGGAQRRVARDAHEHEPRDDRVLRLPGPARPPGAPRSDAGARVPPGLRRAVRRDPADPARLARARGPGRLDRGRRAVRRRRRRVRPLSPSSTAPRVETFTGEVLHSFDYPGAEALRDRATLVVRQRDQRARDRVRSRAGRAGRVVLPQAAVRDPEDRRRRPLGLAVVHALRRARAASRRRGTSSGEGCATGSCAWRARRPTSAPPHPTRTSSSRASRSARTTSRRSRTAASRAGPRSPRSRAAPSRSPTGAARASTRSSARRATTSTFPTSTPRFAGCSGPSSSSRTERSTPTSQALRSSGRRDAVVREHPLPGLHRPVAAVRRRARGDAPRQRRAAIRPADVRPEPAAVLELERHLGLRRARRPRIDRAPREELPRLALRPERDERAALCVRLDADVRRVPRDELRGGRRGHERGGRSPCRRSRRRPGDAVSLSRSSLRRRRAAVRSMVPPPGRPGKARTGVRQRAPRARAAAAARRGSAARR